MRENKFKFLRDILHSLSFLRRQESICRSKWIPHQACLPDRQVRNDKLRIFLISVFFCLSTIHYPCPPAGAALSTGISYAQNVLSKDTLCETIKSYILKNDSELKNAVLEINVKKFDQTRRSISLPSTDIEFKVALPIYKHFQGDEIIPVEIYQSGILIDKIYPLVEINGFKEVVLAKRNFRKGEIFTVNDLRLEKKDLFLLPRQALQDFRDVIGKEAISSVQDGVILQKWMVRDIPSVRRNEKIMLLARAGDVIVKRSAIVLKDAYEGEKVEAKLLESSLKVKGLVRNGQLVIDVPE